MLRGELGRGETRIFLVGRVREAVNGKSRLMLGVRVLHRV